MAFKRNFFCAAALILSACGEPIATSTGNTVITPYIAEAQDAAKDKFGLKLSYVEIYENKSAVCGVVKKDGGEPQQFIYVRERFLLEEMSPSGEWESQWFTECDDG